jgi:sugar phosphate isomerase/epimerase
VFRNLSTFGLPLTGRPSELIELALSFGFDAMDIDILDLEQQAEAYGLDHARRLMVSARLQAGTFRLPVDLAGEEARFDAELEALPKRLELASASEARRAVTTVQPGSDEHAFKDHFELVRRRLDRIGDLLETHGIQLGIAVIPEAERRASLANPFIHSLEGLVGLVSASHPRTGVVVDTWAMHVGGESATAIESIPKGRIVEVRVSDAPRDVEAADLTPAQRLLIGDAGVIEIAPILEAVKAAGFEGPVTPWAARAALAGRGRERIVRIAGDRLQQAWAAAGLPMVPRWFIPVAKDSGEQEIAGLVSAAGEDGRGRPGL